MERRAYPRTAVKGGALVYRATGREQATVRDLSARGIGIELGQAPTRNESMRIVVSLDGKTWLDLRGVVRHFRRTREAYACGIELSQSDPDALRRVETYVRRARARLQVASRTVKSTESGRFRMVRDKTGKLRPVGSEPTPPPPDQALGGVPEAKAKSRAKPKANPPSTKTPPPIPKSIPSRTPHNKRKEEAELRALYRDAVQDLHKKPKK